MVKKVQIGPSCRRTLSPTYLFQELDAGLGVDRPAPLVVLVLVEVEEGGVEAGLGPPELAALHEVVVRQLQVLLAALSLRSEPRMVR